MTFAQPLWLAAGLAFAAFLLVLFRRLDARQAGALADFASPRLAAELTASVSPRRRTLKRVLLVAGTFLLFAALARPLAGYRWEEVQQKTVDVLFAVDVSKSMGTPDVKPDRLTRAKLAVEDLADRLDGDRLGLIAFAGEAFLQCPLTLDADAFRQSLEALDTGTIPRGGTDIASAIATAQEALRAEKGQTKILVLLSDGEDLEGSALDAARAAAKDGLKIYTVGVGTAGGELIPVTDEQGGTGFVRDEAGHPVKSRLDEGMLRKIAEATGGTYQPLGARAEGLGAIYRLGLAPLPHDNEATRKERIPLERFVWPLGAGLLLLLVEPLVGTRRRSHRKPLDQPNAPPLIRIGKKSRAAGGAALLLALGLGLGVAPARASTDDAFRAFQQGDYHRAADGYGAAAERAPDKAELQFNLGSAAYKTGNYDRAAAAFQKSLRTDRLDLQQRAYYNLGDTLYRLGQPTEKTDPQKTIAAWQQAIAAYEGALHLAPQDADAAYNRDFVRRKLEALQKQQEQKKQDQKNQDKKDQDKDKKDQKDQDQKDKNQGQDQKNQGQKSPDGQNQGNPGNQGDKGNQGTPQNDANGQPKPDANGQNQPKPQDQNQKGDQPKPANPGADPKPGDAAQQPKPDAQKKDGKPDAKPQPGDAKPGQKGGQETGAAPEPVVPGKMTKEEAKSLLDGEKGEEQKLPLLQSSKKAGQDRTPEKDW